MADLATLYPQTAPLQGWAAGIQQAQQFMDAQRNNQLNQQRALQDMWKNEQQMPLDLEEKRLINEGKRSTNKKESVAAQKAQYDFDWEKRFENERYKQTIQDYANKHSAGELQAAATRAKQLMLSQNPQEREQGSRIFNMTEDIQKILIEAKARGDQQARVANIHEAGQDRRQAASLSYKATQLKQGMAAELTATKGDPLKQYAVLQRYLSVADPGSAEAAEIMKQRDALYDTAKAQLQRTGATVTIDPVTKQLIPNPAAPAALPDPRQSQWTPPAGWK